MGEMLTDLNLPRVGSVASLIGDNIFIFGGGYKSIEIMNVNLKKW